MIKETISYVINRNESFKVGAKGNNENVLSYDAFEVIFKRKS